MFAVNSSQNGVASWAYTVFVTTVSSLHLVTY